MRHLHKVPFKICIVFYFVADWKKEILTFNKGALHWSELTINKWKYYKRVLL